MIFRKEQDINSRFAPIRRGGYFSNHQILPVAPSFLQVHSHDKAVDGFRRVGVLASSLGTSLLCYFAS
jgi:hypothetical protein